jgi:hypothetical protein
MRVISALFRLSSMILSEAIAIAQLHDGLALLLSQLASFCS